MTEHGPSVKDFDDLRNRAGRSWPALVAARAAADTKLARLRLLEKEASISGEDTSLVVFGSVARKEVTADSDLDWTILVDGQADPEHYGLVHNLKAKLGEADFKGPGREGAFGGLTFSHDVIHYIGGSTDDNANTTRRLLLLLESAAIGRPDAYRRTVSAVLSRYISEDFGWRHGRTPQNVPRFLQNDIARFWRTMAVDFAYKRRDRNLEGWAIRTAKLRLSRKLIYVAGLLTCYACATNPGIQPKTVDRRGAQPMLEFLSQFVGVPPLEVIAFVLNQYPALDRHTVSLFDAYDSFIGLLNNRVKRERLEALTEEEAIAKDEVYGEVRRIGHKFQDALDSIFFEDNGTSLHTLTRTYGVF